jgi:hypothetical protein
MSAVLLLAFYRVGKLTGTKKGVLVGGAIGLILVSIFMVVFNAMQQQYMKSGIVWTLGYSTILLNSIWDRWKTAGFESGILYNGMTGTDLHSAPEYFIGAAILGFVVLAAFSLLQRRFSWFTVSTTGVFTGAMFGSLLWLPMLVAAILKYLTLRTAGTKTYEDVGKPMAVGTLAGAGFVFIVQMLILYFGRLAIGAST